MLKPFVHLTGNDTSKCVLAAGSYHVNCFDKHEKYKALVWVTSILLIPVKQHSWEDVNVN